MLRSGLWKRLALAGALLPAAIAVALYVLTPAMPSYRQVRDRAGSSESLLLDRNGRVLQEMRVDPNLRRLSWATFEEISPALVSAVVAAEDRRFYEHSGVDWKSVGAAALRFTGASPLRGASTLTMQLAGKLRPELEAKTGRRSLVQKLRQALAAWSLERRWTKQQIIEGYLNSVTFRGELQGVRAAARGLFDREPHGLDGAQAALLAVLLRAPGASPAAVASRAAKLTESMGLPADLQELRRTASAVLGRSPAIRPLASLAPHAARRLAGARPAPGRVQSTLELELQEFALDSLGRHLASVRSRNVHDGAVLVVENSTREVLVYVANEGAASSARHVDGIQALRQAGSTLKPFIYARAFQERLLTSASLLEDSPLDIPVAGGVYRPNNYDRRFAGTASARVALASSLNVPAVRVLGLTGIDPVVGMLGTMEFRNLRPADYYGPSLALGSVDVTLWDLTGAYCALSNGGEWEPLHLAPAEPRTRRRVLSPEASWLVSHILSDRDSRSRTFSLESPLATRYWTAVKTGTSKDMRDNWCVGYSTRFTVGVWAGNFSGEPMWDVTGLTGAAPVWLEVMNRLHRDIPGLPGPTAPAGIVQLESRNESAGTSRTEYFIRGTESAEVRQTAATAPPRITYPASGTILALDPDIPPDRQRMFFEAAPAAASLLWVLDGRPLGDASELRLWTPVAGRHRLELRGSRGRVVDSADFEVRGRLN